MLKDEGELEKTELINLSFFLSPCFNEKRTFPPLTKFLLGFLLAGIRLRGYFFATREAWKVQNNMVMVGLELHNVI